MCVCVCTCVCVCVWGLSLACVVECGAGPDRRDNRVVLSVHDYECKVCSTAAVTNLAPVARYVAERYVDGGDGVA